MNMHTKNLAMSLVSSDSFRPTVQDNIRLDFNSTACKTLDEKEFLVVI